MTIKIYDPSYAKEISVLRPDDTSPSYRSFLIKNDGPEELTAATEARLAETGYSESDASYLRYKSLMTLAFSRLGSPLSATVSCSGILVETDIPAYFLPRLTNGWLQLSSDKTTWKDYVSIGVLGAGSASQLYTRLTYPDYLADYQDLSFTIKNIDTNTLSNLVLTATGSDLLSLDGIAFATSINLGTLATNAVATVFLRSYTIRADLIYPAKIMIYDGTDLKTSILFDGLGAGKIYCSVQTVRDFLASIDTSIITSDEEILALIRNAADHIEKSTWRKYDFNVMTDERYDDPGIGKIILGGWPIRDLSSIKMYDHSHNLIKTLAKTDSDWTKNVMADNDWGFIEIPIIRQPLMTAVELLRWRSAQGIPPSEWPRREETTRMTAIVADLAISYKFGYQVPPPRIRDACMKLVVIELLSKKGAADSQGLTSMSMAGYGESFGRGPYDPVPERLKTSVEETILEYRRRDVIAVSIM